MLQLIFTFTNVNKSLHLQVGVLKKLKKNEKASRTGQFETEDIETEKHSNHGSISIFIFRYSRLTKSNHV